MTTLDLDQITATALSGTSISREDALAVLGSGNDQLMGVVAAASAVRRKFFGRRVKLNYLVNLKSGLCPEDCSYCSQSLGAKTGVLKYSWLSTEQATAAATAGVGGGARRVCLVASGRGPSNRDVDRVGQIIGHIKAENPEVEVCACLGFLTEQQASTLHEAGADAYNHNLNSAESNYAEICSTHSYSDRVDTVETAKRGGLSPCSGLIAGMGETDEELVDVLFALRELGVDSVPVNFLLPFEGTPLHGHQELTPQRCLRILAMARLVCPDVEVRAAAGREYHLRSMQPLALEICNSIFLGDYLTSEGQAGDADLRMLADLGFTVQVADGEEIDPMELLSARGAKHGHAGHGAADVAACGSAVGAGCGSSCGGCDHATDDAAAPSSDVAEGAEPEVHVRRRGAGTQVPANV